MEEKLTMGGRDRDRLHVIRNVLARKMSWREAARALDLSIRQVGYVCARVREEGDQGVIHHSRGQPSNHQLKRGYKECALKIIHERYNDFGPTFACEKLEEWHGVELSISTVRRLMIGAELWRSRKPKARHRRWRPRREQVGMLILVDGSEHDWFEGRGKRCVLIIFIDDATSRILYAEFVSSEDTEHLLRATRRYIEQYGRPIALYVDRDSIYKINRQATIEEALRDVYPLTQYTRAMDELGIRVICALSPQAKGRVERSFGTHQDRLVKELRLAGISSIEAANRFLNEVYIPRHNERFAQVPADERDAHRPVLACHDLDSILSLRSERTLYNDWTIRYKNMFFQLVSKQPVRIRPKDKITVEIRLDGSLHLRCKGHDLNYKRLPARAYRPYYALPSSGKYYAPKPGSLQYARLMHISP